MRVQLYRVSMRYTPTDVIVSFVHKGLEGLYRTGTKTGVQPAHVAKLTRILSVLDTAHVPADVAIPAFRLHRLQGQRAGQFSVWVNGNWRVTFRFTGDGDVELLDYEDYQ